jgi:threonine/homoserine/homoserine lactone efflux protein
MPDLALFVATSALLAIAPGPDVLAVLARGIGQGRRAGLAAAAGFAAGCLVHTALAALGVAALIRSSPLAFDLVRYAGAFYLIVIGVKAIRHREAFALQGAGDTAGLATIFRQSVVGNALNPKVTIFFLSFLPQFVDAGAGGVGLQMAVLGFVFMAVTMIVFGAVALFSGWVGERLRARPAIGTRLNLVAGCAFIGLGVRVALPE